MTYGDPQPLTDQEVAAWIRHDRLDYRIAAEMAVWARGQRPWQPLLLNTEISALNLDFVASPSTIGRAKRLLAERGMLVKRGIYYYVAPKYRESTGN